MKKEKLGYCIFCGGLHEYEVRTAEERVAVLDSHVTITGHRAYCKDCGGEIDVASLFVADQKAAFEEYKRMKGFVTAKEIVAFRKKHGLTAAQYAKILHLGEKTITRLENGGIQSESVDLLLRLSMLDGVFESLCKKAGLMPNNTYVSDALQVKTFFDLPAKPYSKVVPVFGNNMKTKKKQPRKPVTNHLLAYAAC